MMKTIKYVIEFDTGWSCDIMTDLERNVYTFESCYNKEDLFSEFELRFHERGEETELRTKEYHTMKIPHQKSKENDDNFKKRLNVYNQKKSNLWSHLKRDLKVLDILFPVDNLELIKSSDGLFKLKHGFQIYTLDEWFSEHRLPKVS